MPLFLDDLTLNKPEAFVGGCAAKPDERSGALTDATTRDFVKQQLAAFAAFIERQGTKNRRS